MGYHKMVPRRVITDRKTPPAPDPKIYETCPNRSDGARVGFISGVPQVGIVASYPHLAVAKPFVTGQAWSGQSSFPSLHATPYVVRRSLSSRTALEFFQGANSAQLCFTALKIRELIQIYHDWPLSPNGVFASPLTGHSYRTGAGVRASRRGAGP